jgi:Bacterial PH domain
MHEIEVYRPARSSFGSFWLLVLAVLFAAGGVWLFLEPRKPGDTLAGIVCIALFGWSAVMRAHRFLLERSFVRLEPEGIVIGNPLRTRFYAWSDVERFTSVSRPTSYRTGTEAQIRVGFYLKESHPERAGRPRKGIDVLLPPDLEDVSPRELARRLDERRMAATGETLAV